MMRWRDEDGMAMVVSLMVAFVVLLLSTVIVAQSIHNLDSSGYDRERLQSVNAAEAGTNDWYSYLANTDIDDLADDCGARSATLTSEPAESSYSAEATFYDSSGNEMDCSTFTDANYPSYVLIDSTGSVVGAPERNFQTYMRLTPVFGGFGAAIMTNGTTAFSNSFDVYGQTGNDGDIYVLTGNLSMSNQPNVRGNVYVPYGSMSASNNTTVWGTVWARDDVTINNPATVQGDVLSETGDVVGDGDINGSVTANGTIDTDLDIAGTSTEGATVPATPTQFFPQISYSASTWQSSGYTIVGSSTYSSQAGTDDCIKARNWIRNAWSTSGLTDIVVRIAPTSSCTFSNPSGNTTWTMYGNLAIISDWGFNLNNQSTWVSNSGQKNLHMISTWPASNCATNTKNITVGNNTNFSTAASTAVYAFFYTPCTATMNNQNNFYGQVMGTTVNIANNFKMTYRPVLVPGYGEVTSFKQDIAYTREVA